MVIMIWVMDTKSSRNFSGCAQLLFSQTLLAHSKKKCVMSSAEVRGFVKKEASSVKTANRFTHLKILVGFVFTKTDNGAI